MKRTFVLIVLDGWGIGRNDDSNPIYVVKPETLLWLEDNFPVTSLQASGISVGLPWGEVGNSEVGHLTLGAGKIIYQYYPRITLAIRDGGFFSNAALKGAFEHARKNNSSVNLIGLLSKGNVHASLEHLLALIQMAEKEKIPVKLQLFPDGKDYPPMTLGVILDKLPKEKIGSLIGRYYAMDREGNWQLTKQAYDTMVSGAGETKFEDLAGIIKNTYQKNATEEFLPPLSFGKEKLIKDGDAIIFFNYREDSIRQIAESFIVKNFDKFPRADFKNLYIATFSPYRDDFKVPVAFPPEDVTSPLGKTLSDAGKNQLRLSESYKYAHVTYFFNGLYEPPFKNEYRVLVPSEPLPHPDVHPQMMAVSIADRLIESVQSQTFDFILVNFANGDTIAHSGNYDACLEAVREIDRELGRIMKTAFGAQSVIMITSDHGNMEEVIDQNTGRIETQHDPNPVPFYLIAPEFKGRKFSNQETRGTETAGILSDVAPTILELMGVAKPDDMTGESLLKNLI